jgi:HEAT repeat protein
LVEREIRSPDDQAAALAMGGWVQLKGEKAVADLLPLLTSKKGGDTGRGAVLRALARLRDPKILAAIQRGARSPRPQLRAGAMRALGARKEGRQLLRRGLVDPDPRVATAALEGLLRVGDGEGLKRARAWLLSGTPDQRKRVLALAAAGRVKVSTLGRETLTRFYNSAPTWRTAIVAAARGKPFEKLFHRALSSDVVEQRREAALKLAQLDRPPEALLEKATRDKDREVRLAAHIGLAKLGRTDSLLALGAGARGECSERRIVVPFLCRSMDARSRGRLLLDALQSDCSDLWPMIWELVVRYQSQDLSLLRAAISNSSPRIRIQGALTALGLRSGAALGIPP